MPEPRPIIFQAPTQRQSEVPFGPMPVAIYGKLPHETVFEDFPELTGNETHDELRSYVQILVFRLKSAGINDGGDTEVSP